MRKQYNFFHQTIKAKITLRICIVLTIYLLKLEIKQASHMCKVNAKLKSNKIYEKKTETVLTRGKL